MIYLNCSVIPFRPIRAGVYLLDAVDKKANVSYLATLCIPKAIALIKEESFSFFTFPYFFFSLDYTAG